MTIELPDEVHEGIETIAKHARAEEIILFGSRARGDHHEDSDWDLLIIVPDGADTSRVSRGALMELTRHTGIEPHPVRRSTFERRKHWLASLSRTAIEEGVSVWRPADLMTLAE